MGKIYKITNNINNKIYVGKTTKQINERFNRHINDAIKNRLNTKLANAIRKYGSDNFKIELLEDNIPIEELDIKETYWISKLHASSREAGYNLTSGGEGGNTYKYKSEYEMNLIKEKISNSKMGNKNPNSSAVKFKNVETGQELHFKAFKDAEKFFNKKDHAFISSRCRGRNNYLWKGIWAIAYENDDYNPNYKNFKNINKSVKIEITILNNNEKNIFNSYAEAERYYGLPKGCFSKKAYLKEKEFIIKNIYKIKVLN